MGKIRFSIALLLAASPIAGGAAQYPLPAESIDVVGNIAKISAAFDDTFVALGRKHGLGYEELIAANPGIDPWLPGDAARVVLPSLFVLPDAPREGIVLNLAEMRLYFFTAGQVQTFPISVGRIDADTPVGLTRVVDKVRDPVWYPPASIIAEHSERGDVLPRIVPPGPDNPLGQFAMQLGIRGYLIHGTNKPAGIGMRVTHGCIRLLPADIEALFDQVPRGTPVHIVNQPYKMGWVGDTLFLEVHRAFEDDHTHIERGMTAIVELFVKMTREREAEVDWDVVQRAYDEARGVPVPITGPGDGPGEERLAGWCSANAPVAICGG